MTFSGWRRLFSNLMLIVIRGNSLRVSVFCFFISWYFLNSLVRKDLLCIVGMSNIFFCELLLLLSILRHIIFVISESSFWNWNLIITWYLIINMLVRNLSYIKKCRIFIGTVCYFSKIRLLVKWLFLWFVRNCHFSKWQWISRLFLSVLSTEICLGT